MGGVLFVADDIKTLKPLADSTLAILGAFHRQGWTTFWTTPDKIYWSGSRCLAHVDELADYERGKLPVVGRTLELNLRELDALFIRKDPPFDEHYIELCWKLMPLENQVVMINPASLLLQFHEKFVPVQAFRSGYLQEKELIPTYWGDRANLQAFLDSQTSEQFVVKPVRGHGGNNVSLLTRGELERTDVSSAWLVQPYLSEITTAGDRRVLFLNGEVIGSFVRFPQAGSIVSNLAQGGRAENIPLTAEQKEICTRLGKFLLDQGIVFAGADLIENFVSEVNITSPTGLRTVEVFERVDGANRIFQFVKDQAAI